MSEYPEHQPKEYKPHIGAVGKSAHNPAPDRCPSESWPLTGVDDSKVQCQLIAGHRGSHKWQHTDGVQNRTWSDHLTEKESTPVIFMDPAKTGLVLSPNDPFERACIDIVAMNRRKRADYSEDGDIFSSFTYTSSVLSLPSRWQSAIFNCAQKLARIGALTKNGRLDDPKNEAVADTILDNAVYGVIAYAIWLQDQT